LHLGLLHHHHGHHFHLVTVLWHLFVLHLLHLFKSESLLMTKHLECLLLRQSWLLVDLGLLQLTLLGSHNKLSVLGVAREHLMGACKLFLRY
jgi:hypothetical protein